MWWPCLVLSVNLLHPVINEVLYDPAGPDGEQEFVELHNPHAEAVPLSAVSLRFVNGSDPGSGELIWVGEPGLELAPGAWFVLGGDAVSPRDRTVRLRLQNGDEALELRVDGRSVDVLAWGEEDLGLGEGPPAGPARGRALGRVPDGADTDDNRNDFRILPAPTPGGPNLAAEEFALARWWARPVWREEPGRVELSVELVARGWADEQRGTLELAGTVRPLVAAAGDTLRMDAWVECALGEVRLEPRITVGGGPARSLGPVALRCGTAALVFTEVQPRPADGEPEWVELLNRTGAVVPLAGWALRDRGGPRRRLVDSDSIAPGERIVFCADAGRLRSAYPGAAARFVEPAGGWPSLNDTGPDAATAADSLHLIDHSGVVVDLVTWRRELLEPRGRSLQRGRLRPGQESFWLPATTGATPGLPAPDEERRWPPSGLDCGPDPFTPDGDGEGDELEVLLVGEAVGGVARVFDLRGDLVRELALVGTQQRRAARWDGRDARGRPVPAGAYVVVVDGDGTGRLRRVIGLGRKR